MQGAVISKMLANCSNDITAWQQQQPGQWQTNNTQGIDTQSFDVCRTCGCAGNFCVHCGKPNKLYPSPQSGCPTCHAVKFCIYCGQPNASSAPCDLRQQQGTQQQQAGMQMMPVCNDQVPMMPMQFVQGGMCNGNSQAMVAMCGDGSQAMVMPSYDAMHSPMECMPMMTMCVPVSMPFQQGLQIQPGSPAGGLQVASNMIAGAATGIQACMVPMSFGGFE